MPYQPKFKTLRQYEKEASVNYCKAVDNPLDLVWVEPYEFVSLCNTLDIGGQYIPERSHYWVTGREVGGEQIFGDAGEVGKFLLLTFPEKESLIKTVFGVN